MASNVATMEVSQQGQEQVEQQAIATRTTRAKSRDILASLEACLTWVEECVGSLEAHFEEVD